MGGFPDCFCGLHIRLSCPGKNLLFQTLGSVNIVGELFVREYLIQAKVAGIKMLQKCDHFFCFQCIVFKVFYVFGFQVHLITPFQQFLQHTFCPVKLCLNGFCVFVFFLCDFCNGKLFTEVCFCYLRIGGLQAAA